MYFALSSLLSQQCGEQNGREDSAFVLKGVELKTERFVAMKRFQETTIREEDLSSALVSFLLFSVSFLHIWINFFFFWVQVEDEFLKTLQHPNVVSFYSLHREDPFLYFVME
jgi:hypothetical protein